jgi:hypothetical protein
MAFAVSESDITVIGNENTWTSTTNGGAVTNLIDTNFVFIKISSKVAVTDFECQLQTLSGNIVNNFEDCKDDDTHASKNYQDLNNGPYKFNLRITSNDAFGNIHNNNNDNNVNINGNQFTLSYIFATSGITPSSNEEPELTQKSNIPAAADQATVATSSGTGGRPPWTACPSNSELTDQSKLVGIPGFVKEIRYETLGTTNLDKILESPKQDIDLNIGLNFVSGTTSGKITNDKSTDFDVLNMHTECEYLAPESAFSPETGSLSGKEMNAQNAKFSNPPFKVCPTTDESATYEFNTQISGSMDKSEINFIKSHVHDNQGVKMVVTQFFRENTGELKKPWYMGELVIQGGEADGMKIELLLDGTDIHTTCLQDTIAAHG